MASLNDTTSTLLSALRYGRGWFVMGEPGPAPAKTLQMYEFEA